VTVTLAGWVVIFGATVVSGLIPKGIALELAVGMRRNKAQKKNL
jgi:hypothetical protein